MLQVGFQGVVLSSGAICCSILVFRVWCCCPLELSVAQNWFSGCSVAVLWSYLLLNIGFQDVVLLSSGAICCSKWFQGVALLSSGAICCSYWFSGCSVTVLWSYLLLKIGFQGVVLLSSGAICCSYWFSGCSVTVLWSYLLLKIGFQGVVLLSSGAICCSILVFMV